MCMLGNDIYRTYLLYVVLVARGDRVGSDSRVRTWEVDGEASRRHRFRIDSVAVVLDQHAGWMGWRWRRLSTIASPEILTIQCIGTVIIIGAVCCKGRASLICGLMEGGVVATIAITIEIAGGGWHGADRSISLTICREVLTIVVLRYEGGGRGGCQTTGGVHTIIVGSQVRARTGSLGVQSCATVTTSAASIGGSGRLMGSLIPRPGNETKQQKNTHKRPPSKITATQQPPLYCFTPKDTTISGSSVLWANLDHRRTAKNEWYVMVCIRWHPLSPRGLLCRSKIEAFCTDIWRVALKTFPSLSTRWLLWKWHDGVGPNNPSRAPTCS